MHINISQLLLILYTYTQHLCSTHVWSNWLLLRNAENSITNPGIKHSVFYRIQHSTIQLSGLPQKINTAPH